MAWLWDLSANNVKNLYRSTEGRRPQPPSWRGREHRDSTRPLPGPLQAWREFIGLTTAAGACLKELLPREVTGARTSWRMRQAGRQAWLRRALGKVPRREHGGSAVQQKCCQGLATAGRTSPSLKRQGAPARAAQVILLNGHGEVLLPDLEVLPYATKSRHAVSKLMRPTRPVLVSHQAKS